MKRIVIALTLCCLSLFECANEELVPPEIKLAEAQKITLWRAGAPLYLPDQYAHYEKDFNKAKDDYAQVSSKMRWLRDYRPVQAEFAQLLNQGGELLKELENEKQKKASSVLSRIIDLREKIHTLCRLDLLVNEGKVLRSNLTKAEIILNEANALHEGNLYIASEEKLAKVEGYIAIAQRAVAPVLIRYGDTSQIAKLRKWANETINESKKKGISSILVIKADRKLLLYKNGELLKTHRVGLGRSGWSDKQYARDYATPEGKYKIIGMNARSRYYKALLINYPNEEDRREFNRAKGSGLLPETASIGGFIEIHGGSNEGMTYGCISLDDKEMEELYNQVQVGTPVTIIGTMDEQNSISSALTTIKNSHGQKKTP